MRQPFLIRSMRRHLLGWFLLAFLAVPIAADAQQRKKVHKIGYLTVTSLPKQLPQLEAFQRGLRELGYVEHQNFVIEPRSAAGTYERLPDLAAELVRLKVDLILSGGTSATRAAQKATGTIPIVMATGTDDPVASGFVSSLARPGRNITGLTSISRELSGKRLELLKEIFPKASRLAVLWNPDNPGHKLRMKEIEVAAAALGIKLQLLTVRSSSDFESAFQAAGSGRSDALMVAPDALFNSHRERIVNLAAKNRLPATYQDNDFVEVGGLMSYGVEHDHLFRRAAYYVDKIFKGAKPADLPVEQPTQFELVINLKTAKTLGITIPQAVLLQADRVIE